MSEYKAGDVVLHREFGRGIVWESATTGVAGVKFADNTVAAVADAADAARRLAVIDPESPEDVERLARQIADTEAIFSGNEYRGWGNRSTDARRTIVALVAGALREYAKPTPEPLAEPTDLAARVIDKDGDEWAQSSDGLWRCLTEVAAPTGWARLASIHGPLRLAGGE